MTSDIVKDLENLIKRQTSQMGEDVLLDAIAEIERLRQMSLDPKTMKEGDKVWWDDPADSLSSGVYTVVEVFTDCDAPADGETIVALRNEAGSEAEVLMQELCAPFTAAASEIERLRSERDEARREVLNAMHPDLRNGYANAREWDCIKEETP